MTSDSLTKPMIHDSMLNLLTTGTVRFRNEPNHAVISRTLPAVHEYDEHDLMKDDDEILEEVKSGKKQVKVGHASILLGMFPSTFSQKIMVASMFAVGTMAQAPHGEPFTYDLAPAMTSSSVPNYTTYFGVYVMIFVVVVMALCFERCARDFVDHIKNKLCDFLFVKTKVKIELPDDYGPQPMDVDEAAELRRAVNHRKRLYEEASEELADKKKEAESWEQCASEYAARNRCMQEELISEQNRTIHLQQRLNLSEKQPQPTAMSGSSSPTTTRTRLTPMPHRSKTWRRNFEATRATTNQPTMRPTSTRTRWIAIWPTSTSRWRRIAFNQRRIRRRSKS
jgi:hypothetical protein